MAEIPELIAAEAKKVIPGLALVLLLAACAAPKPEHDPEWWIETERMIGGQHAEWCADPRGTLSDGSCDE